MSLSLFCVHATLTWVAPSPGYIIAGQQCSDRPAWQRLTTATHLSVHMCDGNEASDSSPPIDEEFSKELYDQLATQAFNDDLYRHLNQRPEYETSEMYKGLRARQDVSDPMYSELQKRRDMLTNIAGPSEAQTPGEVIELVLRALRDTDFPRQGHGIEVLRMYSSSKSSIAADKQVTAEQLLDYLQNSKYNVLLDWVSIQYNRKLDLSLDKRRALQQLKLTSRSGSTVPVTFQLSKQTTSDGDIWLIDQMLVKSVERP